MYELVNSLSDHKTELNDTCNYILVFKKGSAFLNSILMLITNDIIFIAGSMYLQFHEMCQQVGLMVNRSKCKLSYQNALLKQKFYFTIFLA